MDLRRSGIALAVFSLIGAILVGAFGFALAPGFAEAVRARRYLATPGTLTSYQQVQVPTGRGRTTQQLSIAYSYAVAGQIVIGTRISLFDELAQPHLPQLTNAHTSGTPLIVWYDPRSPTVAVLDTRITSLAFCFLLGGAMFLGMALVFWIDAADAILWRAQRRPAGGVFIQHHHHRLHIRLPRYTPAVTGALCVFFLGMISFVAWLIATIAGGIPVFPTWQGWSGVSLLLTSGIVVYALGRYALRSGKRDLVLNPREGLMTLPPTFGRRGARIIQLAAIRDIDVEVREHETRTQHGVTVTTCTHLPFLTWRGEDGRLTRETLAEWSDSGKAFAFVKWLRRRLMQSDIARGRRGGTGRGGESLPSVLDGLYDDAVQQPPEKAPR